MYYLRFVSSNTIQPNSMTGKFAMGKEAGKSFGNNSFSFTFFFS